MKRKLCPRITESMTLIGFKSPDSMRDTIDSIGRAEMRTRSEVVRSLLIEALRARGRIASADEMAEAVA